MAASGTVLAYGELLWDLLPSGPALGGAPANFAFRLQSLGTPARLISRVGEDKLGTDALDHLKSYGVDLSLVQRDPALPTGTVTVTLSERGDASYVIHTGVAYDAMEPLPELLDAARSASVIYFGSLVQRAPRSRQTLSQLLDAAPNAIKFLDINLRRECFSYETVIDSLERADVVKMNSDELTELHPLLGTTKSDMRSEAQALVERFGLRACVVTLGSLGACAFGPSGEEAIEPGYCVKVADTVGSGDSFSAGFIHAMLNGEPLSECCRLGNLLGSLVAAQRGPMCDIDRSGRELDGVQRASAREIETLLSRSDLPPGREVTRPA